MFRQAGSPGPASAAFRKRIRPAACTPRCTAAIRALSSIPRLVGERRSSTAAILPHRCRESASSWKRELQSWKNRQIRSADSRMQLHVFLAERALCTARGRAVQPAGKGSRHRSTAPTAARRPAAPPACTSQIASASRPADPRRPFQVHVHGGLGARRRLRPRRRSPIPASSCLVTNTRAIERTIASIEISAWCSRKIRLHMRDHVAIVAKRAAGIAQPTPAAPASRAARAAARTADPQEPGAAPHQDRRGRPVRRAARQPEPAAQQQQHQPGSSTLRRRLSRIFHCEIKRDRIGDRCCPPKSRDARSDPAHDLPVAAHPAVLAPAVGAEVRRIIVDQFDIAHQRRRARKRLRSGRG